jgi:hypothetical protein
MTQESYRHPITPPPELVGQWQDESPETQIADHIQYLTTRAAQWGADQELEACCEWLASKVMSERKYPELRADRRPKPPSLKEQAIAALHGIHDQGPTPEQVVTIRRALEVLDD